MFDTCRSFFFRFFGKDVLGGRWRLLCFLLLLWNDLFFEG